MKTIPLLVCALAATWLPAQEPDPVPEPGQPLVKRPGGFHLDLLPKAFASNPQIEMTVFSERTTYGRTLPEPTPEQPVYYVAHSQGYTQMGSSPIRENPPEREKIDGLLQRVLEKRGYLPAREISHPPSLALFYYWGSHTGIDLRDVMASPELIALRRRDILERARLVGGMARVEKMAREMDSGIPPLQRMAREEHLGYQVNHDLYYVVVSAYDFGALTRGERKLAWRTTLTVNDQGVSMKETLPPLITSAMDFYGRDTGETLALERRISRGSVTLGPLIIIGTALPDPTPAPAK
ncbi:MAG: hypothetical protein QG602_3424 [Verrucomicrobiota bacterium]|nr:hypothetical protein [Verrucomicrobiota bacterium]